MNLHLTPTKRLVEQRRVVAILVTAFLLIYVVGVCLIPWAISLSSLLAKWSVVLLTIVTLFGITALGAFIGDPLAFFAAYHRWWMKRKLKQGDRIPESKLSEEDLEVIRNKYPGLWQ